MMTDPKDNSFSTSLITDLATFLSPIDRRALGIVAAGGAIGGLLLPVMEKSGLVESRLSVGFMTAPLLGIAAAGISVFVLANCRLEDKLRLLFFSLLCGLTFPTVLATAMNAQSPAGKKADDAANKIYANAGSGNATIRPETVTATTEALVKNNASTLNDDPEAAKKLESAASVVVGQLATTTQSNTATIANIESLKKIGEAAKMGGHDATVVAVASALQRLETNQPTKDAAQDASQQLLIGDKATPVATTPVPAAN